VGLLNQITANKNPSAATEIARVSQTFARLSQGIGRGIPNTQIIFKTCFGLEQIQNEFALVTI